MKEMLAKVSGKFSPRASGTVDAESPPSSPRKQADSMDGGGGLRSPSMSPSMGRKEKQQPQQQPGGSSFPGVRLVVVDNTEGGAKNPSIENLGAPEMKKSGSMKLIGLLSRGSSSGSGGKKATSGFHDITWEVSVDVSGSGSGKAASLAIVVKHAGEVQYRLTRNVAQVQGLRASFKKIGVKLPEVKSSGDVGAFLSEIFQTELRNHDLVRHFVSAPSLYHDMVVDLIDQMLLSLGVNPGSPMGAIVKKRPDVEVLVLQCTTVLGKEERDAGTRHSPRGADGVARSSYVEPQWQRDLRRHIADVVKEEKARQKEDTLRLIDSVIAESLSPEDQRRLRAQPKFQDLLNGVMREDGSLQEQAQNARATHALMKVLALLIHEAKSKTEGQQQPSSSPQQQQLSPRARSAKVDDRVMPLTLLSEDLEYTSPVEGLNMDCQLCGLIVVAPLVASCGHFFCTPCLAQHRNQLTCPSDGMTIVESLEPAPVEVTRVLDALTVRCLSLPHGCSWMGARCQLMEHVTSECEFRLVTCSACHAKVVLEFHDEQECEVSFVQRFQRKLAVRRATVLLAANMLRAGQEEEEEEEEEQQDQRYDEDDDDDDEDEQVRESMPFLMECETCASAYDARQLLEFCEECGGRLPLAECCTYCGTPYRPKAGFCFECGRQRARQGGGGGAE